MALLCRQLPTSLCSRLSLGHLLSYCCNVLQLYYGTTENRPSVSISTNPSAALNFQLQNCNSLKDQQKVAIFLDALSYDRTTVQREKVDALNFRL